MADCSICGNPIPVKNGWSGGNHAGPINSGRCCDDCDRAFVIPTRIRMLTMPVRAEHVRFDEFPDLDVAGAIAKLKAAGFVFITESCPFQLREPYKLIPHQQGVFYLQWDEPANA